MELKFRYFANIFDNLNIGEYFDNGFGWVMIRPIQNTYSADLNFLYGLQSQKEEKEKKEYKKMLIDLELNEKILKEYPKTKWFARIAFFIAIGLAFIEILKFVWELVNQ